MTTRALVLGGGGLVGGAWETGVLMGLADAGVDVSGADSHSADHPSADLVVGTSAGALVSAQITSGRPLEALFQAQLSADSGESFAKMPRRIRWRFAAAMLRAQDPTAFRRRIGAMALRARTVSPETQREMFGHRLPRSGWPSATNLKITAVDAISGEFVVFDAKVGVPLVDAVMASCAAPWSWPPVRIGDRHFIDGGMRSFVNADLAAGIDRVVVIAPLPGGGALWTPVADQVAELTESATVVLITPDAAAKAAIGPNAGDPSRRRPAAEAGRAQTPGVADSVRDAWL